MHTAAELIAALGLEPLPGEGGYFRRTWTGPAPRPGARPAGSAILFLLTAGEFSALHRLDADELWCFHAGDPIEHVVLLPPGGVEVIRLGPNTTGGDAVQRSVPAGTWQGARTIRGPLGWALVTCVMTPGWDERGFVLGQRRPLERRYPGAVEWIRRLTR